MIVAFVQNIQVKVKFNSIQYISDTNKFSYLEFGRKRIFFKRIKVQEKIDCVRRKLLLRRLLNHI